jgi:hypothetical protein
VVAAAQLKPSTSQPTRPAQAEVIPEEVRQILQEAEETLAAGKPDDAIKLALRSERLKLTAAAKWLKARAYCHKRDLGGVNGVRQTMTPAEDRRVKSYCKPYIEL